MKCALCSGDAVIVSVEERPRPLCDAHFVEYFENKVEHTIERFALLDKSDNIAVACSGGKDSITVLLLLHKWGYNITAVLVDEGIANYREHSIVDFEAICNEHNIPRKIYSYEEAYGKRLDRITAENPSVRPCTVCGVFRRTLLHRAAKDFDVLVTGHNLDDEAQAALMNIFKGQVELLGRMGPKVERSGAFTKRVKPLYLCSEKEVRLYTYLKHIPISYQECPNSSFAFRQEFSVGLNKLESSTPGVKLRTVLSLLDHLPMLSQVKKKEMAVCKTCGDPSSQAVCKACLFQKQYGVNA